MTKTNNYYQMAVSEDGTEGSIDIYGDITSGGWFGKKDKETDAYGFSKDLEAMGPVSKINVNISSNGGSVWEGIAIYNMLKRHSAKVTTFCTGAACSIASVIFMAGDERVMYPTSLLMIHNAWTSTFGANANDLRKLAEDMDTVTSQSVAAYMACVNIDVEELRSMMDAETFITPSDALEMGFATRIEDFDAAHGPSQRASSLIFDALVSYQAAKGAEGAQEPDDQAETEPEREPEPEEGPEDEPEEGEAPEQAEQKRGIDWPGIIQALKAAE